MCWAGRHKPREGRCNLRAVQRDGRVQVLGMQGTFDAVLSFGALLHRWCVFGIVVMLLTCRALAS